MARLCCFFHFSLLSFAAFLPASDSSLMKAISQSHRGAGVFLLIEGGKYTFNFNAAEAACLSLNATIATFAQMERALQHGLETCKFGWISGTIAVVPRLTSDQKCGKGKTGVVRWFAAPATKFGVFCFNASALEDVKETLKTSTASPQSTTPPATPITPSTGTTTRPPPSTKEPITTKSSQQTLQTSTFISLLKTARPTRIPTAAAAASPSDKPFPTNHNPTSSLPRLVTSEPSVVTLASSTSASSFSVSSKPALTPSVTSAGRSPGAAATALIVLGVVLLLLTAAGASWYYRLKIWACWPQGQQKDDIETEMWKNTDSEVDLNSRRGAEEDEDEEEADRKYSSDVTLCVNPGVGALSPE